MSLPLFTCLGLTVTEFSSKTHTIGPSHLSRGGYGNRTSLSQVRHFKPPLVSRLCSCRALRHSCGDVGAAAKGVVLGVLQGTKVTGNEALETISMTSSNVVKGTAAVAGDIGQAAKGAVQGAIAGAKDVSVDATDAASAAATGALKAAGEISSEAAAQVRNAVTGTISGVKVVLKEPFKKS